MKKILLTLGTIGAIATPVVAVVSCGNKKKENTTAQAAHVTQTRTVLNQEQIVKNFTQALMADENIVLNPIHGDSMEEFVNNVIRTWTKVQKDGNNKLTFEEGFVFHQWNAASINEVATKIQPIIANLLNGFGGSSTTKMIIDQLKDKITLNLIKEFISEKYISSGLILLVKNVIDETLKGSMGVVLSNSPLVADLLINFITGIIPFAKEGVKGEDIQMNITAKGTVVWKHGDSESPAAMLPKLMDGVSSSRRKRVASATTTTTTSSTTRLGIGSLTKIFGDTATYNLVSGLFEYISTTPQLHNLLVAGLDKYADELLIHRNIPGVNGAAATIDNPINQTVEYVGFEILHGAPKSQYGDPTTGYIDWYRTLEGDNITLKDSKGNILATGTGFSAPGKERHVTFKTNVLPLKANIVGQGLTKNGVDIEHHTITVNELASEFYVRDALMLGSTAYTMLISKMMHYITDNEARNPLMIDFDSKIRTARIVEAGSTSDNRVSVALAALRNMQLQITDKLAAMNVSIEDFYKFRDALKAIQTSVEAAKQGEAAQQVIESTNHSQELMPLIKEEATLSNEISKIIQNPVTMSPGWVPEGFADIIGRLTGVTSTANPGDN